MEKCNCYVEDTYLTYDNVLRTPNYKIVSRCNGTKERDVCSCGGNETKCDFYPAKRAAAQARKATDEFKENRKYTYEETREQFLLALNSNGYLNMCESSDMQNAINALDKQIPMKILEVGKYNFACPGCNEVLGLEKEDIYIYEMDPPKYCEHCGQRLDWE
jgi:hypothetical protein